MNAAGPYALFVFAGWLVACGSQSDSYMPQDAYGAKTEPPSNAVAPTTTATSTSGLAFASSLETSASAAPSRSESAPATSGNADASVRVDTASDTDGALASERAVSVPACPHVSRLTEPGGPKLHFSVDGYVAQTLTFTRNVDGAPKQQCVVVAWPEGDLTNDGKPSRVSATIDDGWFRALENSLARLPFAHAATVRRVIIDNRPTQHGIAPFDRRSTDDARDGYTLWLNEHLFLAPNHWEYGNRGKYFAYHTSRDGKTFDGAPHDHDLFSPILLHEIGHLVMYHFINSSADPAATPACAMTCADDESCETLALAERELGCISPYCKPFAYKGSTENFAEQYRFFYQGSATRSLLAQAAPNCLQVLEQQEASQGEAAPWLRSLPDTLEFKPSRWDSCGGTACKPW